MYSDLVLFGYLVLYFGQNLLFLEQKLVNIVKSLLFGLNMLTVVRRYSFRFHAKTFCFFIFALSLLQKLAVLLPTFVLLIPTLSVLSHHLPKHLLMRSALNLLFYFFCTNQLPQFSAKLDEFVQ